jgi:hypothetical protein
MEFIDDYIDRQLPQLLRHEKLVHFLSLAPYMIMAYLLEPSFEPLPPFPGRWPPWAVALSIGLIALLSSQADLRLFHAFVWTFGYYAFLVLTFGVHFSWWIVLVLVLWTPLQNVWIRMEQEKKQREK